jgi:hypothetical protein
MSTWSGPTTIGIMRRTCRCCPSSPLLAEILLRRRLRAAGPRLLNALAVRARAGADAAPRTALPPLPSAHVVSQTILAKILYVALHARSYMSVALTSFEPLESGRQFMLMEHALFRAIGPDEIFDMSRDVA